MPFFSAVVPTYNRRELLRENLASIFQQTFNDYEVIVVDDGSTDGTSEMLAQSKSHIQILRQIQNRGTGAARNLGARHASGRYVAFLDSDDVWFPWALSTYARVIQEHDEPSFVTGMPLIFSSTEQLNSAAATEPRVETFSDYYASADKWRWFSASSFVIRRDRLTAVNGFHEEWGAEDADLAMMLGTEKGFVHITSPQTFGYREHQTSLKGMPTYTLDGSSLMLKKEKNGLYPGGRARQRDRLEILTRHMRPVILDCLKQQKRNEAWQLYRQTLPWHVKLGRWKFLLGFPLKACGSRL